MTLEAPIITRTGTVSFNRKVQVRPYETAEAFIAIQFDIPTDEDLTPEAQQQQIMANAKAAFFAAKALVFEELGLQFEVGEGGVVRELITQTFGPVTEVTPTEAAAPANVVPITTAPSAPASTPPFDPETKDKDQRKANQEWARALWVENPGLFFDNRAKKASGEYKSTAPDVKHKDTKIGVWL